MTNEDNDQAQFMRDKARENSLFYYPTREEIDPDPDSGRVRGTDKADQPADTEGAV